MTFPSPTTPVWISHRGFTANAVENTFSAFKAAAESGFTALETDLRITRDRHIVLIHDPTLRRLTGDPRRVSNLSRHELESIRLATNDRFLFFEQLPEWFNSYSWTFDIKPENGKETIRALAEQVAKNDFLKQFLHRAKFLTWRVRHERLLKSYFPWADCYARREECWRAGIGVVFGLPAIGSIKPGRRYALPPFFGKIPLFKSSVVRHFHQRNAKTIAFLPQTDVLAQQAALAGFDEILTNGLILEIPAS